MLDESLISIKLFIQKFQFHLTHFSCWMRWTTFFFQQYVKIMPFYCNRISKIRISIRKLNKSCFVCQITVSVQRLWTKAWPATALLILLMRESQKRKDAFDAKDTASAAVEKTLVNANEKKRPRKFRQKRGKSTTKMIKMIWTRTRQYHSSNS